MTNGRNWAIVVGIDKYWTPSACLNGAVQDAIGMTKWLLDKNGGGVDPRNLFLLLSPKKPENVPVDLKYKAATRDNLIRVITKLVKQSSGKEDRLFFHFSGHGFTARSNFTNEDALVPEDCTPEFPDKSLGLNSILDYLKCTQLHEQFFFLDTCRNIPWEGEFHIGRMPLPKHPDPNRAAVQQFVFYATSPGQMAIEDGVAGVEQGAFTQTLLAGLRGKGEAKAWDSSSLEYVVEVTRLLVYLHKEMTRRTSGGWFQEPRLDGEHCSNPVLARFSQDAIKEESLEILLDPFKVEAQAVVTVKRDEIPILRQGPVARVPVTFKLPPRIYTVNARAVDFEPEESRYVVELYEPQLITIRLISKPVAPEQALTPGVPVHIVEPSDVPDLEPTVTPSESVEISNAEEPSNLPIPDSTVTPVTTVTIPAEAAEVSVAEPVTTSKVVVSKKATGRYRRKRPNWKATLRFLLDKARNLVGKYREIIHKTDLANLQKGIAQAESALLNDDKQQGVRATSTLQKVFRNGHTETRLCIAHMLAQESPHILAVRIARTIERLRKAYRTNDRVAAGELTALIDLMLAELVLVQLKSHRMVNIDQFVQAFRRISEFFKRSPEIDESIEIRNVGRMFMKLNWRNLVELETLSAAAKSQTTVKELMAEPAPSSWFVQSLLRREQLDIIRDDWVVDARQSDLQSLKSLVLTESLVYAVPIDKSLAERFGVKVRITLRVTTHDPVAPLEIASSTGQVLKIGQGTIACEQLEPGFYRARVVLPEGHVAEKLIEASHRIETIILDSPRLLQSRLLREMLADPSFNVVNNPKMLRQPTSKWSSTQVSTLLLLSAGASRSTNATAESGLKVFFGLESDAHGSIVDYNWRFWSQQEKVSEATGHVVESPLREGLAEFSCFVDPGDYWLAVQSRKRQPNVFALKLLPGRLTILIFHVNAKGESRIFQYFLPSTAATIELDNLRRLDLMQRFYLSGRLDHAYGLARTLVESGVNEPTALCLSGYLMLKLGRWYEAGQIADQVVRSFNELSDGYVLTSEWEASRGNPQAAADACKAALERGFPIFTSGLNYLFYRVRNSHIEHTRRKLLENMFKHRVRALMWSAWSPEVLSNASFPCN